MPDDAAMEKSQLLQYFGADVERVPPVSIINPNHFVNKVVLHACCFDFGSVYYYLT